MSESAGRILMIPKGTYSPTTTYDPLDAVKYGQNSYVCKQTSRGNLPTNTTYWQPLTDVTADENPTEDSTNLVQSGGVYSALRTIKQTLTNQVKDMNNVYGSKNLLIVRQYTRTYNGVSITVNDDGSISFKGTPSAAFNLSANTRQIAEDHLKNDWVKPFLGKECIFSSNIDYDVTTANITIAYKMTASDTIHYINSGSRFTFNEIPYFINVSWYLPTTLSFDTTWKPMIRLASIEDDTHEPYAKTNQQLTQDTTGLLENTEVNGAVNMLPNNATTQVINGITFTVNDDGTITCNGTATGESSITLSTKLKKGTYRFSGIPKTGSCSTYWSYYQKDGVTQTNDFGDGVVFHLDSEATINCVFRIKTGYTASNLIFKPMLTVPSYNGDYVPYAKTNRELTEDGTPVSDTLTRGTGVGAGGANYATKVGKLVTFCLSGHTESEIAKNSVLATLPYLPKDGFQVIAFNASTSGAFNITVGTDGKLKNTNHIIGNDNYFIVNGVYVTS